MPRHTSSVPLDPANPNWALCVDLNDFLCPTCLSANARFINDAFTLYRAGGSLHTCHWALAAYIGDPYTSTLGTPPAPITLTCTFDSNTHCACCGHPYKAPTP